LLTLMFCIVSWKKTLTKKGRETLEMVYEHGCKATMFNQKALGVFPPLLRPCIIITRTVASLFVSIAIVELIIFNAIANYVKGINAGSSLIVLFFGMLFHLCVLTFKFKKPAHDGPMIYARAALPMLLMLVGVWLMFMGYTDIAGLKDKNGEEPMFAIGSGVILLGLIILVTLPSSQPYTENSSNGTLSLVLSGEYYTAFCILDCFMMVLSIGSFMLMMGIVITMVQTHAYAVPFYFLHILPIYGFVINIFAMFKRKSQIMPLAFNMVLMIWFELCIVFSMLHVCAIPGVNMGCAAKLEHTSFNVNWLVSLFWLILLFMIAAGVIDADYAPNFLLNYDCMREPHQQAEKQGYPQKQTDGGKNVPGLDPDYSDERRYSEQNKSFEDRYRGYRRGANAL
ncbi:MAG: hypothetical protein QMC37_11540, partial [Flavobacteriales bacterium]